MRDKQSRPYLRIKAAVAGTRVQVDGDFTCIPANAIRVIKCASTRNDKGGNLYISCKEGYHYLDGQYQGNYLLGIYGAPNA